MATDIPLEERLTKDPEWTKKPLFSFLFRNLPLVILFFALFLIYGYFLSHKIDLVTADLGRHIKNGEVLLTDPSVLTHNYYSYTNADFQVINHHWGSGFLLYLVWKVSGFVGVQLFFILLSFASLAVFLAVGRLYVKWDIVGLVALFALPLLAERTEIRPEVFSYLFVGIFFYVLCRYREESTPKNAKLLWFLPATQLLWVNSHIYFLLGPLIFGAFLLESLLVKRQHFLKLFSIFGAVILATMVNPFGIKAITGAVTLFQNFGYKLAENQSVWFMEKLMFDPNFFLFKVFLGLLILSFALVIAKKAREFRLAHFFVILGIGILACLAIRNLSLFGLFLIPVLSANSTLLFPQEERRKTFLPAVAVISVIFLALFVLFSVPRYFPYWHMFGWGLENRNDSVIRFIREQGIKGPLFNNYDIGGYLIFHLFPGEKVFVDNRPEAYPARFFEQEYIPMQENEQKWTEAISTYKFNAIVFSYHDATPWGQKFLTSRIKDAKWAPVYVDERVLILLHRTEENASVIQRFEIPKDRFVVR